MYKSPDFWGIKIYSDCLQTIADHYFCFDIGSTSLLLFHKLCIV